MIRRNSTVFGSSRVFRLAILLLSLGAFAGVGHGQTTDLHDLFPHLQPADWQDIAAGRLTNRREVVEDIFARLGNIPEAVWRSSLAQNQTELSRAVQSPDEHGGQPFEFSGRVLESPAGWRRPVDDASGVMSDSISSVLIEADDGQSIDVLVNRLPGVWQGKTARGQFVQGRGLFLGARGSTAVLVTDRLQWLPDQANADLLVDAGKLQLARHGFDIGLLDDVKQYSDAALVAGEHAVFRSLLRAVAHIGRENPPPSGLFENAPEISLVALARQPVRNAGEIFSVRGELRRITPVEVSEPSLQQAIGGDRYYQLDVFIPLGNQQVLLEHDQAGQPIQFNGSYGVTVLISELPADLDDVKLPIPVEVPAFFLKNWRHKSLATRAVSPTLQRPNPVFVGIPGRLQRNTPRLAGGLIALLIPAFWGGLLALLCGLVVWSRSRGPSWLARQRQRPPRHLANSIDRDDPFSSRHP